MEDITNFNDRVYITSDGSMVYPKELNTKHIVINVASECGYTDTNYNDLKDFLDVVYKEEVRFGCTLPMISVVKSQEQKRRLRCSVRVMVC